MGADFRCKSPGMRGGMVMAKIDSCIIIANANILVGQKILPPSKHVLQCSSNESCKGGVEFDVKNRNGPEITFF